jgi:hypothetical protein
LNAGDTSDLGRFYCEHCHGRFDSQGDCPRCPEEPLLDLSDEDVRLMLDEMDHRARTKRFATLGMISAVVTVPVCMVMMTTCSMWIAIPLAALFAGGLTAVLGLIFRARRSSPELTDSEIRFLQRGDVADG